SEYVAGSIGGGANNGIYQDALADWSSQFNYGQYYFQFKDDNNNMTYDSGEIYAVSLENGTNGEMHTLSYDGFVHDLDFMMFWWMAYDFEFYPNDGEMDELWIFDGEGTPPGWELFQWGNASMSITDGSGMYENSNALTFVQGDVWSGGGFNIAPPLHLDEMWGNSALMFWMWSEPDAPLLRLQFEDGVGKVGMHFEPAPEGGWNYYGFRLEDFYFIDGSTDFNESAVTVFQVMAEGNGVAGRTFHFDEMYIGETEDDGGEPILFDFVGDMDGHWYFVSQQPMSWHDGLNFTDTVDVGGDIIHMATINSPEENDFVNDNLNYFGIESGVWIGLTDEFEEGNWQWVTGEPVNFTNWVDGEPNNSGGLEHYAEMYPFSGEWNDAAHDFANRVLIEYIPNQAMNIAGEWQIAPMPGALRVGPEPFNGDYWANSAEDVQVRACYFDDRYVFDQDGFHNDQGDETWIEFWQGGDYNGDGILDSQDDHCGAPMYPHDGSSNPAGVVLDEAAGTLTLNGLGAYIGLPKAVNGFELASPGEAPESVTYQMYMQQSPRMMTLVIEVGKESFGRLT
ncbi:MAG: lectin-like protein, partial [Candidatus Neomarinimicrobiota bacterium]